MNVLITSPSLDTRDNVSGISTVTRLLLKYNTEVHYYHFLLGKKDRESRNFAWLITMMKIPFRLIFFIKKYRISAAHFNLGFEPPSLLRDFLPYLLLSWLNIALCLHIHGGRYMASVPDNSFLRFVIRIFLRRAKVIVVLSGREKDFLKSHYPFLKDDSIYVIPNAVEVHECKKKEWEGLLTLLYLGRLDRKKGLQTVADVLNQLSASDVPYRFLLCGMGPDKEWFLDLLSEKTRSAVMDKGVVFGESKEAILVQSHLFLLPSFFEGLPMAMLESMGYAVVPVVTPVGSIPDVVRDQENGFLVHDSDSIVRIISRLNDRRDLLAAIGLKSQKTIEGEFSISHYVDRINGIYRQFLV